MKKYFLIVALLFASSAVTHALELVPKPVRMWQGTQEIRLRSAEPVVEITEDLQEEEYHLEITESGRVILKAGSSKAVVWGRHTLEQLLAQAWESLLGLIRDGLLEADSEGVMLRIPKK